MRAYVIFTDSDRLLLKPFKKDFRHCFIILEDGVLLNPLRDGLMLAKIPHDHESLADTVTVFAPNICIVDYDYYDLKPMYNLPIMSCVELVKKVLRINAPLVVTPYQLYKHLKGDSYGYQETNKKKLK